MALARLSRVDDGVVRRNVGVVAVRSELRLGASRRGWSRQTSSQPRADLEVRWDVGRFERLGRWRTALCVRSVAQRWGNVRVDRGCVSDRSRNEGSARVGGTCVSSTSVNGRGASTRAAARCVATGAAARRATGRCGTTRGVPTRNTTAGDAAGGRTATNGGASVDGPRDLARENDNACRDEHPRALNHGVVLLRPPPWPLRIGVWRRTRSKCRRTPGSCPPPAAR